MKKNVLKAGLMFLVASMVLVSCDVKDNPSTPGQSENQLPSDLEEHYFAIQNATYVNDDFPEATTIDQIEGLSVNLQAIRGGQNIMTITTTKEYKRFFVGVQDVKGYWDLTPVNIGESIDQNIPRRTETGYLIPIMYSILFNTNITMHVAAEDADGKITTALLIRITFIDTNTQPGDLNVNLFFENEKDVDLHLTTPSGMTIFYGNRGGEVTLADGRTISFGLDLDSNPSCNIDGVKNENIYIPEELVENGTYIVQVNMYSNCDPSISTDWSIVARYNGNLVQNEIGPNPAFGTYPVNAPDFDYTTVMQFTINKTSQARAINNAPIVNRNTFKPYPLSDVASMKAEEASWK